MLGGYLRILLQLHHCSPRRQPELARGLAIWPEMLVPADGLVACVVPKAHSQSQTAERLSDWQE